MGDSVDSDIQGMHPIMEKKDRTSNPEDTTNMRMDHQEHTSDRMDASNSSEERSDAYMHGYE